MGLFSRKKDKSAAPTQSTTPSRNAFSRSSAKDFKIVCPYCFNRFDAEDVHFRAEASATSEKKVDEVLDNFWKTLKHADSRGPMELAYDPKVVPGEKKYAQITGPNGKTINLLSSFIPTKTKAECRTRICPKCHNKLPAISGAGKSHVIAVIGSTQIGKTVFINSLMAELGKIHEKYNFTVGQYAFLPDKKAREVFESTKRNIELGLVQPTDRGYIEPLLCTIKDAKTGDSTILSFYDFPGESTEDDIKKFSEDQFRSADGLIILFDLTRTNTLFEGCKKNTILESNQTIENLLSGTRYNLDQVIDIGPLFADVPDIKALEEEVESLKAQVAQAEANSNSEEDGVVSLHAGRGSGRQGNIKEKLSNAQAKLDRANADFQFAMDRAKKVMNDPDFELQSGDMDLFNRVAQISAGIGRKRKDSLAGQLTALQWLSERYEAAFDLAGQANKDHRPIAFVGTKSDEVLRAAENNCFNDSNITDNSDKLSHIIDNKNGFNSLAATEIDAFVQTQLLQEDADYKHYIASRFDNYKFFAVSALGTKYDEKIIDGKLDKSLYGLNYRYDTLYDDFGKAIRDKEGNIVKEKVFDDKITPWRVDEPMYWVLNSLGIIPGRN